ncbi:MAG: DUF4190 domain-containing protein [Oscillospiraceae bacterium]|nr:DUF4190 domain-containing protein [Oscillospiraceae bacterium]
MSVELENRQPDTTLTNPDKGKPKAIASLVLGIISIVFGWVPLLGLACGIVGLVMSSLAKKDGCRTGMTTAGLVLSIIGVVFGAIYTIMWAVVGAAFGALWRAGSFYW